MARIAGERSRDAMIAIEMGDPRSALYDLGFKMTDTGKR
jgi:hypothetical protein